MKWDKKSDEDKLHMRDSGCGYGDKCRICRTDGN